MKKVELCTTLELSKLFDITRTEVLKCVAEGMPKLRRNCYSFSECFDWYFGKESKIIIGLNYDDRCEFADWDLIDNKLKAWRKELETAPNAWGNLYDRLQPLMNKYRPRDGKKRTLKK